MEPSVPQQARQLVCACASEVALILPSCNREVASGTYSALPHPWASSSGSARLNSTPISCSARIDRRDDGPVIPITAVTSEALNRDRQTAPAAGCDDDVPKPFIPRQLLAKIRKYLQ